MNTEVMRIENQTWLEIVVEAGKGKKLRNPRF
jgi:hypothetical protein